MERVYWRCTDCGAHILLEFVQECPICGAIVDRVDDDDDINEGDDE